MRKLGTVPPRRKSSLLRFAVAIALVITIFCFSPRSGALPRAILDSDEGLFGHPIDALIRNAHKEFDHLLRKEAHSLSEAAKAYRKRRGRHPPPGFDKWYKFASERNAIMVEDFWDQVYHDLDPFWALEPLLIRKEAADFEMVISVRNGRASAESDWFWTQIWLTLIQTIETLLPDMDLALNAMDEPRLVVPWEDMRVIMKNRAPKKMDNPKDVVTKFQYLPGRKDIGRDVKVQEKNWEGTSKPPYRVCLWVRLLTCVRRAVLAHRSSGMSPR